MSDKSNINENVSNDIQVIENENLIVKVSDKGAELISVYDKSIEKERIWCADDKVWNRHAPLLFPFVGKVTNGRYIYKDNEYEMSTQHGFARDMTFTCILKSETKISHKLVSNAATKEKYPFDFELIVTHEFDENNTRSLKVSWQIKNTGTSEMLYSIGGHPGFSCPLFEGEKRSDYYVNFPGLSTLKYKLLNTDKGLLYADKTYELPLTKDLGIKVSEDMFDKDALVVDEPLSVMQILSPDGSIFVSLECEGFTHAGIWSKPEGDFICLEPWAGRTDNDGLEQCILEEKAGIRKLDANKEENFSYKITF